MSDGTGIDYLDATWNPVAMRCTRVSAGCDHCWHLRMADRHAANPNLPEPLREARAGGPPWLNEQELVKPLHWRKPRVIGVQFMGDLFHESVPDELIYRVFDTAWKCPQHTFLVLTKRERVVEWARKHASALEFNWGCFINHHPMKCGDPFSIYNNELRNNCGWCCRKKDSEDSDHNCQHPESEGDYCNASWCPIGTPIDRKAELLGMGELDEDYHWIRDGDGQEYAEETDLVRLHSRPMDAFCSNVWIGVSVENQDTFNERVQWLHALRSWLPHAILFLSIEPCLGAINAAAAFEEIAFTPLAGSDAPKSKKVVDWVICGGESGPGARPMHPDWARSLRDQCAAAGVPFWFKQWGEWCPKSHLSEESRRVFWNSHQKYTAPWGTIDSDGHLHNQATPFNGHDDDGVNGEAMLYRVGKKAAGHRLDGREHRELPG
jgi:protein gp37